MSFDQIRLESEQRELLATIVEACRNVPREKRQEFNVVRTDEGDFLLHPGLGETKGTYMGDVNVLAKEGLIDLTSASSSSYLFDVSPLGFDCYEYLKQQAGEPIEQVQEELHLYIDTADFKNRYPVAHTNWQNAQQRLWSSESERELTTIGHSCREAMQGFADVLVKQHDVRDVDADKAHTVKRIRTVLKQRESQLGQTHKALLEALLSYWGTVNDLVQRQEHGAQREGEPLKWEDARRVTFQTLIVMYEIDRALHGT